MSRDPRYDILFEPVKIGPVTARNRFYQVPHCNGMGRTHPTAMAVMRGVKAEGGWAVLCTEQCDIHSDDGDQPRGPSVGRARYPDAGAHDRAGPPARQRWPESS